MALLLTACATPLPAATPTSEPAPVSSPAPAETATLPPPTAALTSTPAPSPTPTEVATSTLAPTNTPTPEPERVRIFGNGNQFVNMRREPGTSSGVVKSVRDGTEVTIVGIDREDDGRIWRNVQDGDAVGWIVSTALRAIPTPTVTPGSTATATPSATPPPTSAQRTPTASATASGPIATPEPERVEVTGTGGQGANLRAEPGTGAPVLQTIPDGTRLTIVGDDREVDGRTWRNVRAESGTTGWLVTEVVSSLATPTPAAPPTATTTPTPEPTIRPTPSPTTGPSGTPSTAGTPSSTSTPASISTPGPATPPNEPGDGEPEEEPTEEEEPERVQIFDTGTQGANLRARPGRSGSVLRSVPDGSVLTIVGEDQQVDGIVWRNVQTDDGTIGWLAVEVVRTLIPPTPTPRPGAPGIGAPLHEEEIPEEELSEEQRIATPCRPGQIKGDASTGTYYSPDRPEYPDLRLRVRCFDDEARARASGFQPPDPLPPPEPSPEPDP